MYSKEDFLKFNRQQDHLFMQGLHFLKYLEQELDEKQIMNLVDFVACLDDQRDILLMFALMGQRNVHKMNVIHFFTRYMPKYHPAGAKDQSVGEWLADIVEFHSDNKGKHPTDLLVYVNDKIAEGFFSPLNVMVRDMLKVGYL